jgi:hypothetical protein
MICKAASLSAHEVTDAELKEINKHTLEPLKAEDVYTFKAVLCDNEVDRTHERFTLKALQDFQKLFIGKTVIKDHYRSADNQVARIYATELVQGTKTAKSGELYTQLVAHCYMVKTASNADLIAEIKAGIKKEGSVGCAVSHVYCSICGTDNAQSYCRHWPGKSYEKEGGTQVCTFSLDGGRDAYEFSLVAVPAQKAAGVSKSYTGETVYEPQEAEKTATTAPETPEATNTPPDSEKAAALALRARLAASRDNLNKNIHD